MSIVIPSWLKKPKLPLPPWAKVKDSVIADVGKVSLVIEADTKEYVEEWFKLLGVDKPDQYWLEVAYQCAKLDLQMAVLDTEFDPRHAGKAVEFRFSNYPPYALKRWPEGKGLEKATKGKEAREHYKRIRGRLPF